MKTSPHVAALVVLSSQLRTVFAETTATGAANGLWTTSDIWSGVEDPCYPNNGGCKRPGVVENEFNVIMTQGQVIVDISSVALKTFTASSPAQLTNGGSTSNWAMTVDTELDLQSGIFVDGSFISKGVTTIGSSGGDAVRLEEVWLAAQQGVVQESDLTMAEGNSVNPTGATSSLAWELRGETRTNPLGVVSGLDVGQLVKTGLAVSVGLMEVPLVVQGVTRVEGGVLQLDGDSTLNSIQVDIGADLQFGATTITVNGGISASGNITVDRNTNTVFSTASQAINIATLNIIRGTLTTTAAMISAGTLTSAIGSFLSGIIEVNTLVDISTLNFVGEASSMRINAPGSLCKPGYVLTIDRSLIIIQVSGVVLSGSITASASGGRIDVDENAVAVVDSQTAVFFVGSAGILRIAAGSTISTSNTVVRAWRILVEGTFRAASGTISSSFGSPPIDVVGGSFVLENANGRVSADMNLMNGGVLSGEGEVSGFVNATNGGVISPGFATAPGVVTISREPTASSGTLVSIDIFSSTDYDQFIVFGWGLDLGGCELQVQMDSTTAMISDSDVFEVVEAGLVLTGSLGNVAHGSRLATVQGDGTFLVEYAGSRYVTLSDFQYRATPVPSQIPSPAPSPVPSQIPSLAPSPVPSQIPSPAPSMPSSATGPDQCRRTSGSIFFDSCKG